MLYNEPDVIAIPVLATNLHIAPSTSNKSSVDNHFFPSWLLRVLDSIPASTGDQASIHLDRLPVRHR